MTSQLLANSSVTKAQLRDDIPEFKSGSVVDVHYKIKDGDKERVQIFSGVVISKHRVKSLDASFTVLKNSTVGIKVERTFPLHSPFIEKVVVVGDVKRAKQSKLYHLHDWKDPIKQLKTRPVKTKA